MHIFSTVKDFVSVKKRRKERLEFFKEFGAPDAIVELEELLCKQGFLNYCKAKKTCKCGEK